MASRRLVIALLSVVVAGACVGEIIEPGAGPDGRPPVPPGAIDPGAQAPSSAIPRLSRREIEAAVVDVFGVTGVAETVLPADADLVVNPATNGEEEVFDTFVGTLGHYLPSEVFVSAVATMAFDVAEAASADTERVHALAGCVPTDDLDATCMRAFIDGVGRRLYRRPLTDDEGTRLAALAAELAADGDFYLGARVVIQSLLSSPDFIYRPEIGEDLGGGLYRLDNFELVARLSALLWGEQPTETLLSRASGPDLTDAEVAEIVQEMAADPLTDAQVRRFHVMWLRYQRLLVTDPALAADMLAETDALLDRVLTGSGAAWSGLFTSEETFVSPALATHYGMAVPASADWVAYDNLERAGILAHGSFLSLSSTRGDGTLPSRRGAMISRRLLCIPILPPPPDVDVDDGVEVPEGACKSEAYQAHREAGSTCQGCHAQMDAIGFGFERFDGLGAYRTVERENSACTIDGAGSAAGQDFSGPRGFASVVSTSGDLTRCGTRQFLRFAFRRALTSDDFELNERVHEAFLGSGEDFRALLIELATDPAFRHRVEGRP